MLEGTEKQIKWAEEIKKELLKDVADYKDRFNNAEFKRNYIIRFKAEIKAETTEKLTLAVGMEALNKILDRVMFNIERETSAKKLIDVKQSFKLYDANIEDYLIRAFM